MSTPSDHEPDSTVLLAGIVGSTAYGMAGPHSDIDRLGMFAVPTLALLGLRPPAESTVSTEPDVTMHEASKAVRLLLGGNPTVAELLWLPDDLYETRTPLGDEAIGIRSAFLSAKRTKDAYFGYASQQFRKLLSRDPAAPDSRTAKQARHLMRLVEQGYQLYTTGTLQVRLSDPQRYLDFGERTAANPQTAAGYMAEAIARFNRATSVLPVEPDSAVVEDWLLRVRREYWSPAT